MTTPDQTTTAQPGTLVHAGHPDAEWWRSAVIYQIYPRSWADDSGNGVGDLLGITAHLPYLAALGVNAIWLSPFYPSPQADAGYDVSDYRDVDPRFGSLADADAMIARAHELGLKVIVDLVPNHSSDEHVWFQEALAAGPGSPERERYMFREGAGDGSQPPNNWESVFGGPAWTRVEDGQWYLHLFDAKQPDFNWENPQVREEFESVLRFWLDRGVDGFRVDVAHGLIKAEGLPDWSGHLAMLDGTSSTSRPPMWDQDEVHQIYRGWRALLEEYGVAGDPGKDRIMCAEAWVDPPERAARYVREDEFHQAFNFDFLQAPWRAQDWRTVITDSYAANDSVGAPTTWVLSNHDVIRHASRLGLPIGQPRPNGIGAEDPQPDAVAGLRRARAATTVMLALPGSAYIYYGEELGLPDHTTMPDEFRQDPAWFKTNHREKGRDGCRVPMPWHSESPALGFNTTGETWLPQPESYRTLTVDLEEMDPNSTLNLYRRLLALRRELDLGEGSLQFLDMGENVLAFRVESKSGAIRVICNFGLDDVELPSGATVLATSGDVISERLPTDTAVWLAE